MEDLLTTKEIAERLRVHVVTVRRWYKSGKLKGFIISKRGDIRYRKEDLERFIGVNK